MAGYRRSRKSKWSSGDAGWDEESVVGRRLAARCTLLHLFCRLCFIWCSSIFCVKEPCQIKNDLGRSFSRHFLAGTNSRKSLQVPVPGTVLIVPVCTCTQHWDLFSDFFPALYVISCPSYLNIYYIWSRESEVWFQKIISVLFCTAPGTVLWYIPVRTRTVVCNLLTGTVLPGILLFV